MEQDKGRANNISMTHRVILEKLSNNGGIKDTVTGEVHYHVKGLRYVLGSSCKIPRGNQRSIIKELIDLGYLLEESRDRFVLINFKE